MEIRIPRFVDTRILRQTVEDGDIGTLESLLVDVVDMHTKADLLATAIKCRSMECIGCLLQFGADPFLKHSDTRRTALYWTVFKDDAEALCLLLRDIHRDPVAVAIESLPKDSSLKAIEMNDGMKNNRHFGSSWEQGSSDLSYRTRRAMNEALFEAASLGSLEPAKVLIQSGANPNVFYYHDDEVLSWCSPLIAACYIPLNTFCNRSNEEAEDMVKLLVESGADVSAKNYVGDTAMHWAAACGLCGAILVLLRNGADVNARNQASITPIMTAVDRNSSKCYETAQLLLDWGANINDVDYSGWSALCYAVNSTNIPVTEMLLEKGALPNYSWERSEKVTMTTNPLFIATSVSNRALIKLLVSYNADVNCKAGSILNPVSPFASCLQMGNFELADFYLQLGVDFHDAWSSVQDNIQKTLGGLPETMVEFLKPADRAKLNSLNLVKSFLSCPRTLMSSCRLVILDCVSHKNVRLLPLPESIKSFLSFDEVIV